MFERFVDRDLVSEPQVEPSVIIAQRCQRAIAKKPWLGRLVRSMAREGSVAQTAYNGVGAVPSHVRHRPPLPAHHDRPIDTACCWVHAKVVAAVIKASLYSRLKSE